LIYECEEVENAFSSSNDAAEIDQTTHYIPSERIQFFKFCLAVFS